MAVSTGRLGGCKFNAHSRASPRLSGPDSGKSGQRMGIFTTCPAGDPLGGECVVAQRTDRALFPGKRQLGELGVGNDVALRSLWPVLAARAGRNWRCWSGV